MSSPTQTEDSSSLTSSEEEDDDLPRPGKVWQGNSGPSLSTLLAQHRAQSAAAVNPAPAATQESNVEVVDPTNLPAVWKACLRLLTSQGPGLHALFSQGKLVAIEDDRAILRFSPQHETFVVNWEKNGKKEVVREAISQVINQKIGVKFEIDAEASAPDSASSKAGPTPVASSNRIDAQRPEPSVPATPTIKVTPELVASLRESEPLVKELMDKLGAQIIKVE